MNALLLFPCLTYKSEHRFSHSLSAPHLFWLSSLYSAWKNFITVTLFQLISHFCGWQIQDCERNECTIMIVNMKGTVIVYLFLICLCVLILIYRTTAGKLPALYRWRLSGGVGEARCNVGTVTLSACVSRSARLSWTQPSL